LHLTFARLCCCFSFAKMMPEGHVNPNANYMNGRGFWLFYILVLQSPVLKMLALPNYFGCSIINAITRVDCMLECMYYGLFTQSDRIHMAQQKNGIDPIFYASCCTTQRYKIHLHLSGCHASVKRTSVSFFGVVAVE
jgi:hypothetical protein